MRPILTDPHPARRIAPQRTAGSFRCMVPELPDAPYRPAGFANLERYWDYMPFVRVGQASALQPDTVMEVLVDSQPYAVCNVAGAIRAVSGVCLHRGGPLGQGQIHEGRVVCPYHMWEFDCVTGEY